MFLKRVDIQGFKSFAHKTALTYNRELTAIVGPNGSGKSNIADAIRWGLGEQSLKTLRGKKAEDVIFAGSDKKSKMGLAQVDLHIDNKDKKAPIDYSEVIITRRLYRNGDSEYLVNNAPVRLTDVQILLAKCNFGQRSYSVIGQGMIESILIASPQERKDFFDEAVGVRQYQIKKEQAINKLKNTKNNLKQADGLIQEIEPRLRSLTRQVRRLERREDTETKLRDYQIQYYGEMWHELRGKLTDQNNIFNNYSSQKEKIEKELNEVQKKFDALAKEETRDNIFFKLQKQLEELNEKKNSLLKEQVVYKGKIELEHRKQGKLSLVWQNRRLDELAKLIQRITEECADLRGKIEQKAEQLEVKKKQQDQVIVEFKELERGLFRAKEKLGTSPELSTPQIRQRIKEIAQKQKELFDHIFAINNLEELNNFKETAGSIDQALQDLQNDLEKCVPDKAEAPGVSDLEKKLTNFLETKDSLVNEVSELKIKINTWQNQIQLREDELERLRSEHGQIEEEIKADDQAESGGEKESAEHERRNEDIEKEIKLLEEEINKIENELKNFNQAEQQKKDELFVSQNNIRDKQNKLNELMNKINEVKVELARLETRREDMEKEINEELGVDGPSVIGSWEKDKEKPELTREQLSEEIKKLKHQIELIGAIDPETVQEYKECEERYSFLTSQSEDLDKAINDLEEVIKELDETIKKQFNKSFDAIGKLFDKYFRTLFEGGSAKLILQREEVVAKEQVDTTENNNNEEAKKPEEEEKVAPKIERVIAGIEIKATPPGKKLSSINMLSGGEKALTSIALICAIIANNPSPFVVLDEVDAALDEANSIRFAAILDNLAQKTQFITITHNRATMKKATILYGVTMTDEGISKLLSVKMDQAEEIAKTYD